ncbi:MAG: hypothetical protein MMC23_000878 [Stictis urceolatum]|nr:hypothetical protein [Stictis urceolata]
MYDSFGLHINGGRAPITLSQHDQRIHARNRKALAHALRPTAIRDYERCIDEIIELFIRRLKEKQEETSTFLRDFEPWIRFHVTDTILYLVFGSTFGSIFGFLDVAKDSVELFHNMNKDSLKDILDRFLDAAKISAAPGIDYVALIDWCLTNVQAGSETIPIELISTLYHLLQDPEKLNRLVKELDSA